MADSKKDIRRWIKAWENASLSLKELKKKELSADDYYERNWKILDEMLQYACENSTPRPSSGLVEQQRLFMKMKDKRHS